MFSHWSETHRQWLSLGHRAANQTQPIITLDRDYRNCVKSFQGDCFSSLNHCSYANSFIFTAFLQTPESLILAVISTIDWMWLEEEALDIRTALTNAYKYSSPNPWERLYKHKTAFWQAVSDSKQSKKKSVNSLSLPSVLLPPPAIWA